MIDKVLIYESTKLNPYYNLAVESALLDMATADTLILFLWQNDNTVVIGKHQNAYLDVNVKKLYEEGGLLARRPTGGGAVYHDIKNLNFSFITTVLDYDKNKNNEIILRALNNLNLKAQVTGRNDLEIGGKKFSGNAYLKKNNGYLHHGTILIDVDKNKMSKYLNVKPDKFLGKGVSSVKSRVVNLCELDSTITVDIIKSQIKNVLYDMFLRVTVCNVDDIDKNSVDIYQNQYSSACYLFGHNVKLKSNKYCRFSWGYADIHFSIDAGIINDIIIYSDTLNTSDIESCECELRGKNILNTYNFGNNIAKDVFQFICEN